MEREQWDAGTGEEGTGELETPWLKAIRLPHFLRKTCSIYVECFFLAEHSHVHWVSSTAWNSQVRVHAVPKWIGLHQNDSV